MFVRIPSAATILVSLAALVAAPVVGGEDEDEKLPPPVTELEDLEPLRVTFEKSSVRKPIELKSAEQAKEFFSEKELAELEKQVDFDRQMVLVFAWRGSGGDRLTHAVAESYPEQVFYTYERGLTRDLRPHVVVHALRSNVRWKVR